MACFCGLRIVNFGKHGFAWRPNAIRVESRSAFFINLNAFLVRSRCIYWCNTWLLSNLQWFVALIEVGTNRMTTEEGLECYEKSLGILCV